MDLSLLVPMTTAVKCEILRELHSVRRYLVEYHKTFASDNVLA